MKSTRFILVLIGVILAACVAWAIRARITHAVPAPPLRAAAAPVNATFVGRDRCVECHQTEASQWKGSHHDLAMQEATPATVLGDFSDTSFEYYGLTTTFSRRGDEFHVRTDGPDGALHDYKIAFTFGVYPLQQYLIEFPGGRFQALNVCWDSRPKDAGGQRWFHLYPDQRVTSNDILHWTGPYQNWNHMCAECHSTAVHKNYDAPTETFGTQWSEIDVSCESCHGPGSEHVAWGNRAKNSRNKVDRAGPLLGLVARLREEKPGAWYPDPATGIAKRDHPRTSQAEIETCARCHSRRGTFHEDVHQGGWLADTHRLALLEPMLYEADGQILDEDYEYGSFIQSRMYAAGVTCTDCHNVHSLKTAGGNQVCARCHLPEKFETKSHHFHTPGERGSACVDCHMPTRTYMVVHARHDHSIRVPRPDLTVSIGTPNACNGCHADRTPQWAANEIATRTPGKSRRPHFGEVLSAGRRGLPDSGAALQQLLADRSQPAIARATAVEMLEGLPSLTSLAVALGDESPLVRSAAVAAFTPSGPVELATRVGPLLRDPIRQVRIDAARKLATLPDSFLDEPLLTARSLAMNEYLAAQSLNADRAEARLSLGALYAEQGRLEMAEREYLAALRCSPRFPATYVNLGDLYRQWGREAEALRVLREGMDKSAENADVSFALGLALVRNQRLADAIPLLKRASELAPDSARYAYVYAVALETVGPAGSGIEVLKGAHQRRPNDVDVLAALVEYCRGAGRNEEAEAFATLLARLRNDR